MTNDETRITKQELALKELNITARGEALGQVQPVVKALKGRNNILFIKP